MAARNRDAACPTARCDRLAAILENGVLELGDRTLADAVAKLLDCEHGPGGSIAMAAQRADVTAVEMDRQRG
ncbi:MAG: hypothetical protein U1E25_13385 [Methylocystis sp.]